MGVVEVAFITPFISNNAAAHIRWWDMTDSPISDCEDFIKSTTLETIHRRMGRRCVNQAAHGVLNRLLLQRSELICIVLG